MIWLAILFPAVPKRDWSIVKDKLLSAPHLNDDSEHARETVGPCEPQAINYPPYSVLISLYAKESTEYLHESMDSIFAQTVEPEQIVVVKDGVLTPELDYMLDTYAAAHKGLFTFVTYPNNHGLWYALGRGIAACRNELVMRMDVDDWSATIRAEEQLKVFLKHPEFGCVGTSVVEFVGDTSNPVALVDLPENHKEILKFGRKRCPYRHPSLMYRKSAVEKAGGYQQMPYFEDYDLYMRLSSSGCQFYNIQKPLVYMRTSPEFYARRGGVPYLKCMLQFERACLQRGNISIGDYLTTTIPHAIVCLMPNTLRSFVYAHFLRKSVSDVELSAIK
jgi:cellulose synthase/poly-beta-1,6-N-acetylglucosamine synthase-like glycosyltransferase